MVFESIRSIILPFRKLEQFVPKKGTILDIGCGHGVLTHLLATSSPKRTVVGIDPDKNKIKEAKKKIGSLSNLSFKKAFANQIKGKPFSVITMTDVLYLLPMSEKQELLKVIRALLKPKGVFILKEVENEPRWMYFFLIFEEMIMQRLLKLTFSKHKGTFLTNKEGYISLLKQSGFKVIKTVRIRGLLPYPHILFVARKS